MISSLQMQRIMVYYKNKGDDTMQYTPIKDVKAELEKEIKYKKNVHLAVKVYECEDFGDQISYEVEVFAYSNDEYLTSVTTDSFNADDLESAMKRGSAVLRTVRQWFQYDDVKIENGVEVYRP
jgi:hypothetical protein